MKSTAIKAAKEAGRILLDNFGRISKIEFKSKKDIVTNADLESEKRIIDIILSEYPDHNILAEESGDHQKQSDYTWIIDPLDGTTNYACGNPYFCISIALAKGGKVILGVAYAPFYDELFVAEEGKGAFLNDTRLVVTERPKLKNVVVFFSNFPNDRTLLENVIGGSRDIRKFGATVLDICSIAANRVDAGICLEPKTWDFAAACHILEEANGKAKDFSGNHWNLDSKYLVIGDGKLVEELLKLIQTK